MPDIEQDSEDLASAATRLGLTVETIRKRLQRGKLKGFKTADGTWRVVLDKVDKRQDEPGQTAGQEQDRQQDKPGQEEAARIKDLKADVEFLRSQLQARDEQLLRRDDEIRRVHVLLQQAQQQSTTITDQRQQAADQEQARQPWWRRFFG